MSFPTRRKILKSLLFGGTAIAAPTNIAFCGPELDLFLSANLGRWHISEYDLGKIGQPLNYPEVA